MKKILGIIVLSLLTSCAGTQNYGSGDSNEVNILYSDADVIVFETFAGGKASHKSNAIRQEHKMGIQHCGSHNKKLYAFKSGVHATSSINVGFNRGYDHLGPSLVNWYHRYFCANDLRQAFKLTSEKKIPGFSAQTDNYDSTIFTHYEVDGSSPIVLAKKNELEKIDIEFTIKDKKEQCTAIGFAPATEKFADCVLRLVELDVKSQQAAQIALAQSQGNQQVVTQLQNQTNNQSSQAFIDFGLKLLSPQSTVSAPSTSTCRVIGSGAFKTVNCW